MSEPKHTCALYLSLDGTLYKVRRLEVDPPVKVAWRLYRGRRPTEREGQSYMVHMSNLGNYCECRDFLHRRNPKTP